MNGVLAQLGRFATVGVVATLVHVGVAWAVQRGLGAAPMTANLTGFVFAFACSYLGHFYWTFGQRAGHRVRLPRFLAVSGLSLVLTSLITWLFAKAGLPFEASLIAILLLVPATTWTLSRWWAFRDDVPRPAIGVPPKGGQGGVEE